MPPHVGDADRRRLEAGALESLGVHGGDDSMTSVDRLCSMKLYEAAYPFQEDVLALPVEDLDATAQWYADAFGLQEVERREEPVPTVILERDGVRIGFAINGGDASMDGAAILVTDIKAARAELKSNGVKVKNWRIDKRDGKKFRVFFVVAPDGLCYYFHQQV